MIIFPMLIMINLTIYNIVIELISLMRVCLE